MMSRRFKLGVSLAAILLWAVMTYVIDTGIMSPALTLLILFIVLYAIIKIKPPEGL